MQVLRKARTLVLSGNIYARRGSECREALSPVSQHRAMHVLQSPSELSCRPQYSSDDVHVARVYCRYFKADSAKRRAPPQKWWLSRCASLLIYQIHQTNRDHYFLKKIVFSRTASRIKLFVQSTLHCCVGIAPLKTLRRFPASASMRPRLDFFSCAAFNFLHNFGLAQLPPQQTQKSKGSVWNQKSIGK